MLRAAILIGLFNTFPLLLANFSWSILYPLTHFVKNASIFVQNERSARPRVIHAQNCQRFKADVRFLEYKTNKKIILTYNISMKTICFTGGGTLGHVMPNLYLMEELRGKYNFCYIGSDGIEKTKIPKDIPYHIIPAVKLVRGKIFSNLKIPFVLIKAIFAAKAALKKISPALVFSKGGYVSLPVCIAARMLHIPILAHESDYSFGLANKIILKLCTKMCVNFKNLEKKNKKIVYTGPIFAKSFDKLDKPNDIKLNTNKPTLLILCGSLGAKSINELVTPIIDDLLTRFNIIHIYGKNNTPPPTRTNYIALPFYDDMAKLYNVADFMLGRSGAGVSSECFYKQIPMLLIPLENSSSRGDQVLNAKYYADLKVAKLIHQQNLTPEKLKDEIISFYSDIKNYNASYPHLQKINGRQKVVGLIADLLNKKSG